MEQVVTVGLDIAKNLFHAHGVAQDGKVVFSRKLRRAKLEAFFSTLEPCLIGIEACSTSHHWARVFMAMGGAHGQADAACLCEALRQKSEERCGRC